MSEQDKYIYKLDNGRQAMVPLAAPELILLDFESAAISAFRAAYPNATVKRC